MQKLIGEILKGVNKGAGFASDLVETTVGTLGAATDTFRGNDKVVNENPNLTQAEKDEYNRSKNKRKTPAFDKTYGTTGGMYPMQ